MNARAHIEADPLLSEALRIVNSKYHPRDRVATHAEWVKAAQRALDGDSDDLECFLAYQDAYERGIDPDEPEPRNWSHGWSHPDAGRWA